MLELLVLQHDLDSSFNKHNDGDSTSPLAVCLEQEEVYDTCKKSERERMRNRAKKILKSSVRPFFSTKT